MMRCIWVLGWVFLWGQDTLYYRVEEVERLFLERNLLLIAQKLRIEAERALVWQARLWPNPQLTIDQVDLFTRAEGPLPPFLETPRINQIAGSLSQTLLTAGKRLKGVALAEASVRLQEAAFAELLRQLRKDLRLAVYGLVRDQMLLSLIADQDRLLQALAERYRSLSQSGLVPLPEYLRIENLALQVQADLRAVRQQWEENQHALRRFLRLQVPAPVIWIDTVGLGAVMVQELPPLDTLLGRVAERPDVRLAKAQREYASRSLELEKALAIPNVDALVSYDRLGGYRFPQWGVGFSTALPVFHRNQGRILAARKTLEAAQAELEAVYQSAQSEVIWAWRNLQVVRSQWEKTEPTLLQRYRQAEAAYRENLLAGRVSFLAYVDFFQSYRDLVSKIADLWYAYQAAWNQLAYATGQ